MQADNEEAYGLFFYDKTLAITPKNSQQKFVKAASQCLHWSAAAGGPPLSPPCRSLLTRQRGYCLPVLFKRTALKSCALCTVWKQHINTVSKKISVCSVCLHLCKPQTLRQVILLCSDYSSAANIAQSQNIIFSLKSLTGLVKCDKTDTKVNSTHCLCLLGCQTH